MATLTVKIAGLDRTAYMLGPTSGDALAFIEELRARPRFTAEFLDRTGVWYPQRGQGITVEHSSLGLMFGGYINNAPRRKAPKGPGIFTRCECAGYEQVCDRRHSIARTWIEQTASGIFQEIVEESLIDEGFTVEVEAGPTLPYFSIEEPRPKVRAALDRLCELASTGGDIFYWDVQPAFGSLGNVIKVARFFKQSTYPAPFNLSDANPYVLQTASHTPTVDETNQGKVNRVFVYLGQYLLDPVVEDFTGDGSTQVFELSKPCGATPTLTIDDVPVDAAQVGIDGSDTGKQWYWSIGSNRIRQDDAETPLSGSPPQVLSVSYQGLDRRVTEPFTDEPDANAEGVLQGDGTGIYETILTLEGPSTLADAETAALAYLARYTQATITFRGATFTEGLRKGQEIGINLTGLDINLTMLIESVTMTDVGRGNFLWSFTAIYGPARDDWKRALLGKGAPSSTISGSGAAVGGGSAIPTAVGNLHQEVITADTSIASPHVPVDGEMLIVDIYVDAGGPYVIDWDSDYDAQTVPDILSDTEGKWRVLVVGISGKWVCPAMTVGGRP